jgi:hypothetical protein
MVMTIFHRNYQNNKVYNTKAVLSNKIVRPYITEEYQDGENSYCEFVGLVPFLQLPIHMLVILPPPPSPYNDTAVMLVFLGDNAVMLVFLVKLN